jgi:hypothetical protein
MHSSDCHMSFLFQYRADFPSAVQKQVVFVDLAPIFTQMADSVLRRQIHIAIDTISEVFKYLFSICIITLRSNIYLNSSLLHLFRL